MKVPEPRKLKSGNYFIQLRLNGQSVPVTAATARECKRQAELLKAEHRNGKRMATSKQNMTLDEAITAYIDSRRPVLSPSTIRGYEAIQKNRFKSYREEKLKDIDWQQVINTEIRTCSPKTLKNAFGLIVSVSKHYGFPVPIVKLPQVPPAEKEWLEPEQIPVFVEAVREEPFAIPALLALHGLRRSEIFALTWNSIDLDKKMISVSGSIVMDSSGAFVRKAETKTTASRRTVPIMIPALYEALVSAKSSEHPVISGSPVSLYKQVNRVCTRCGLPLVGVHGLRHSFASLGYHLGIPPREIMELGGWSDIQTMQKIYTHLAQSDRLKAENKITSFFKNANENANK